MEKYKSDDTFLARWISGDLSEAELLEFKKSKDYKNFKRINDGSQQFKVPSYNKEKAFSNLKDSIQSKQQNKKVVKLIPSWVYSAAAILVVAFGVFFFLNNKESHFETGYGEQLAIMLPDDSKVQLNANSELDFNKKGWEEARVLNLKGEAFFDVEKGTTFKVVTPEGTVEVLGTEFNVIARQNYFEVQCHEGRVQVKSNTNHKTILTQGKAFRIFNTEKDEWMFTETKPTWIQGESTFKNAPLSEVIKALENQYKVNFDVSNVSLNKRFTGSFTHKNINLALQTVFTPLDIIYTIKNKDLVILSSKK